MALGPIDPLLYAMLGTHAHSYINDERYEEAAKWSEKAVHAPGSHYLLSMLAAAAQQSRGDHASALYCGTTTKSGKADASANLFLQAFQYQSDESRRRMDRALRGTGYLPQ